MAHHKSAKKRIRSNKKRTEFNKTASSKIKTLTKKVLSSEDVKEVEPVYKETIATLDRSVTKGRLHKNTAARKKSALTKHVNKLSTKPAESVKA